MKALLIAAAVAALLVTPAVEASPVAPTFAAHDPCLDGTAPTGWLREGGYCDISHNLNPFGKFSVGGGGSSGCVSRRTLFGSGCLVRTYYNYRGDQLGVYRVDNAIGPISGDNLGTKYVPYIIH